MQRCRACLRLCPSTQQTCVGDPTHSYPHPTEQDKSGNSYTSHAALGWQRRVPARSLTYGWERADVQIPPGSNPSGRTVRSISTVVKRT